MYFLIINKIALKTQLRLKSTEFLLLLTSRLDDQCNKVVTEKKITILVEVIYWTFKETQNNQDKNYFYEFYKLSFN